MLTNVNLKKNIRVFSGVRTLVGDDFVIEKDGKTITAKDFLASLSTLELRSSYNESYNLNLTIVPKTIDFDVDITVTPWEDAPEDNNLIVDIK